MRSLILSFMLLFLSLWNSGSSKATNSPKLYSASGRGEDFHLNEEVYVYCYFKSKQPFDVKWYKNGQEIQGARYNFSDNNQVLTIPKPRMSDQGRYLCKGINQYGEDSRIVIVIMHLPICGKKAPKVYNPLPTVTIEKGKNVTLVCIVQFQNCESYYRPAFRWRNSGGNLLTSGSKTEDVASTGSTLYIMRLTKQNVKKLDSAMYECAVNSAGIKTNTTVKLTVVDF
mgnify:CR=1 FL=1